VPIGPDKAPPLILSFLKKDTEELTHLTHFDNEDGSSMYLSSTSNIPHIHIM
jgi:hypothetical protein